MNKLAELYISRAENELAAAGVLFEVSGNEKLQMEEFRLERLFTFYSNAISNSYYCIFFAAKAILAENGINTKPPQVHLNTLNAFEKHIVKTGKLDVELLRIYKGIVVKADELLGIFESERIKRGKFTYKKLPQANLEPANESLKNAQFFFKAISKILRK